MKFQICASGTLKNSFNAETNISKIREKSNIHCKALKNNTLKYVNMIKITYSGVCK